MNTFSNSHPAVIMTYFVSVISIAMFVNNPVIQITALIGALLYYLCIQKNNTLLKNLKFLILIIFVISLTNPLFVSLGNTEIFSIGKFDITLESLIYGVSCAVMIISVIIWFMCYNEIMTGDKFIFLFGRVIPKLSLVLSMSLRFVPLFMKRARKVKDTQKAMGRAPRNFREKLSIAMQSFTVLLGWSLENSIDTADSMKARGFNLKNKTTYSSYKICKRDVILLLFILALTAVSILGIAMGNAEFKFYPQISGISVTLYSFVTYACYLFLSLLPFILEVKEKLKWKYYVSRI